MEALTNPQIITNPVEQVRPLLERPTYGFVNTRSILDAFATVGWAPVSTQYAAARVPARMGYQKHIVRLRHPDYRALEVDNTIPELVLLNSHDGGSSMQLLWGAYRVVCSNGMIVGRTFEAIRVVHSARVVEKLPAAIQAMMDNFGRFAGSVKMLSERTMTQAAVDKLVRTCYDARLDGIRDVVSVDYTLPALRREDQGNDAWTVFNRVQEKLLRGGVEYVKNLRNAEGKVVGQKQMTTRKAGAVPAQVKYNQLAYDTVMELVG